MDHPQISIIVPLYNEERVFEQLINRLSQITGKSELNIEIVLVDDGSSDGTAYLMQEIALNNEGYQSIFLSRNFGHQTALTAGLIYARCSEAAMIIDGDLQDPPEMLFTFYGYLKQGYDVVYGVRKRRKEGFLKKLAYKMYYRLLKRISQIHIPLDSGDFAMISRRVIDVLNNMPEESRYLRGMRAWVGLKQTGVEYERDGRADGDTKYSLRKLISLALNGIFNFSNIPIKFISNLGITIVVISVIYLIYTLVKKIFFGTVPEGFTGLLLTIILFSGVQLISIGVIGEYILRIFFQVKDRPLFVVKNRIVDGEDVVTDPSSDGKKET